ncbi:MAG: VOC family protein [Afipia sp.]|nr:VOC family protein [Afipia sp.]
MADFIPPAPNVNSPFADMRGHHVAVRTPDLEAFKRWYVEVLDFRVVAEWQVDQLTLAFIAPPTDDDFYIEILGGSAPAPQDAHPFTDLESSLAYAGYHHFCLNVASIETTVEELRRRDVKIVVEPILVEAISRRIAFFADPFGNLVELAEVLA